ncbi:MAG: right-handed parallel beta-helix repeat-containing protein [Opitutaceae bacterium]|nr:right-handed parallel beta-helix repeat-containing protein [Opitutaceae bacterium]
MLLSRILFGAGLALALGLPSLSAIIDRNADGLSDVWVALYFPKGAVVAAGADTDGDGVPNLQESVAGTDPLYAASRFAAVPPQTDAAGNLVLRWRGAWGKRYLVESSTDLKTWTTLPELHIGRGQELSVIVRAAGAAPEARRYWRVAVADVDTDGDGMSNAEEIELGRDPTSGIGADGVMGTPRAYGAEFFVSPAGSDANPGTEDAPFLTLETARTAVRTRIAAGMPAGGIAVWLRGGVYERKATLLFGAADSGTSAQNSVDWRAWPGEEVRLVGGKRLPARAFTAATSASPIWERLDPAAWGRVLQYDLGAFLGLRAQATEAEQAAAYGTRKVRGWALNAAAPLELFIDTKPMPLARWPDATEHSMPVQDIRGDTFMLQGNPTPAVGGTFAKYGVRDGVSAFKRDGLVDGLQYYLRRYSFTDPKNGALNVVWFLTTAAGEGWDFSTKPNWLCWQAEPGVFTAIAANGAAGTPSALAPLRVNRGYAYTAAVPTLASFVYAGTRPERWLQATDAWVEGFWEAPWAQYSLPVAGVDPETHTLTLQQPPPNWGLSAQRPWYAFNLLEEITQPGEWYLDRASGLLYLWPPEGFGPDSEVVVSTTSMIFELSGAQFVSFRDLVLEDTRGHLFTAWWAKGVALRNLTLRNCGQSGATVQGEELVVSRCTVRDTGSSGLTMSGGDRKTLTHSANVLENCEVQGAGRLQISSGVAVDLDGCGHLIRNNHIHDTPSVGVFLRGSEHRIELNDLHDIGLRSGDCGAIYACEDWGARGNVIRRNFIHDIRSELGHTDLHGIYMDETVAGIRSEDNVIYRATGEGFRVNGGRDNIMRRNLVARCGAIIWASDWGRQQFANGATASLQRRQQNLIALGYKQEPWLSRYPECAEIPNTWNALIAADAKWLYPEGCELADNVFFGNTKGYTGYSYPAGIDVIATYYADSSGNLRDQDPLFVDEAAGDLRLQPASPAFSIPGWTPFPFDRIGVRE